jgi:hypothetical protein
VSLRDKVEAHMRGEVSTADLVAVAAANGDAYDMLDDLPTQGVARLCAWCAFVIQTHADNLLDSGSAHGYCAQEPYEEARVLYGFAGAWLDRARSAATDSQYRLDVVVPQPYPRPYGAGHPAELRALRKTLESIQAHTSTDIEARKGEPIYERLLPTIAVVQSALDSAVGVAAGHEPGLEIEVALTEKVHAALDRAYQAGQLLAMPELLAKRESQPVLPQAPGAATLALFRPGDPGFDPWCLTDPLERAARRDDGVAGGMLDEFWKGDPNPDRTVAIQVDIASALERGAVDYLPEDLAGSLKEFTRKCPWPGALWAKVPLTVGGQPLDAGDRFVLAIGGAGEEFRCAIVRLSAKAAAELLATNAPSGSKIWGESSPASVLDMLFPGFDVLDLLPNV